MNNVTPIKKDLLSLFDMPRKIVSPIPPTPKRQRTLENHPIEKKDSSPLALPDKAATEQGKKMAEDFSSPQKAAVHSDSYVGSVILFGYGCVKKEEKVVFPDGTIYSLSATWVADPKLVDMKSMNIQTDSCESKETSTNTMTYVVWPIADAATSTDLLTSDASTSTTVGTYERPIIETTIEITLDTEGVNEKKPVIDGSVTLIRRAVRIVTVTVTALHPIQPQKIQ
ncbi:unnamed protein product [Mytilus coruscus]|uniref:Uncharacterized protein n=1 Tax=Mytilus coruscus TaxID=42192 RepID=A0A6J8D826_MYTCO|nr:unnamed protein product [Mytilus coruscus]